MKHVAVVALFATSALASACPDGLYSNPLCCGSFFLGLIGTDCAASTSANNATEFRADCAATGDQAGCCVYPIVGQALLCQGVPEE